MLKARGLDHLRKAGQNAGIIVINSVLFDIFGDFLVKTDIVAKLGAQARQGGGDVGRIIIHDANIRAHAAPIVERALELPVSARPAADEEGAHFDYLFRLMPLFQVYEAVSADEIVRAAIFFQHFGQHFGRVIHAADFKLVIVDDELI